MALPQPSTEIKYRADIDGLRAIAVLLVVSFHAGLGLPSSLTSWVGKHISNTIAFGLLHGPPGGFVGVDIFFVISGFLISGILLREQQTGTFSIRKFYERRIRRIVPALTVVLLFTWVIGYFALPPAELADLSKSTLAATFSAANIYFWRTSSYFDMSSLLKPLLHTWSLAVEEQFYVVFPIILLLLHRNLRSYIKVAIVVMALASFIASIVLVYRDAVAAFYLPHTRAWELLLGAIVSLDMVPPPSSKWARNLVAVTGMGLILFSAFHYNADTLFPGVAALAPCLGASMLIAAHRRGSSVVGNVLSWKPVVFIGLISYSLYLWHWPLLLINKYDYFEGLALSKPVLFLIMLVFATLSWRFVEQPFRTGSVKLPQKQLFWAAAAAASLVAALNLWTIGAKGMPYRYTAHQLTLAYAAETGRLDANWGPGCFASRSLGYISPSCLTQSPDKPNYLLFGDSHAAHFWYGLSTVFPEIHWTEATASSCRPFLTSRASRETFCRNTVDAVFDEYLPNHHVDAIILSSIWDQTDFQAVAATIAHLHATRQRVYVIGPIEAYDQPLPDLLIKVDQHGDATIPARHLVRSAAEYKLLDDQLEALALANGADRYVSLRKLICPNERCVETISPGVPLQFDVEHLTNAGSLLVAGKLRESHQLP